MVRRPAVRRRRRGLHLRAPEEAQGGFDYLDDRRPRSTPTRCTFNFNKPWSPALYDIGQLSILPKHIWSKLADPAKYTNAKPVGTGPYTEVDNFQTQSFELRKNPNYWQPDKQKIAGIQMLAFAGNDGANLAAANGDVDWAPQFIPNIEKTFVAKDKDHSHYWFPPTGAMINWQLNTTKAPFNDVDVRKALSMAVDRDQVTKIGMSGYTASRRLHRPVRHLRHLEERPRSATLHLDRTTTSRKPTTCWTRPATPRAPTASGPSRTASRSSSRSPSAPPRPTGSPWPTSSPRTSAEVGVTARSTPRTGPPWSQATRTGDFDSGIVWSANDPSPYKYFSASMGTKTVKPVGTKTFDNYHRFGDPKADALLDGVRCSDGPVQAAGHCEQAAGSNTTRSPRWCRCSPARNGARTTTPASPAGPPRTTRTPRSRSAHPPRSSC